MKLFANKDFVHWHNHSSYSNWDGLNKIVDMTTQARKMGFPAFALTDHGNIQGILQFLKFSKTTGKVNFKDFIEYQATRTNPKTKKKEKYTRDYETDKATFNSFVKLWWLTKRGIVI
ncbi:hypothetical protein LCGC14_2351970 [marine sediment metagenome]|uniref:Polymerase/histidinol phosphatase N-terminal domain-containing protein n=1 Tax=marine sediment metagenome TaxID=412755 RepID=A0A0F9C9J6_9ZZZZ